MAIAAAKAKITRIFVKLAGFLRALNSYWVPSITSSMKPVLPRNAM